MKSKIFKIVLPFAFMMAIVASFAFTPAENNMADESIVTSAWYQNPNQNNCQPVSDISCDTVDQGQGFCTIQVGPNTKRLYLKDVEVEGEPCNIALYEPQP